jgi:pimeloyl-ACP methyl ester carboxylesterase
MGKILLLPFCMVLAIHTWAAPVDFAAIGRLAAGHFGGDSLVPLGLCLENYPYPYPVQYITLHEQGEMMKMAYMDVRPEHPNGHTILLLHGKNFCGLYWGPTARMLAGKGYRVIIPDQIGFGKSAKPEHLQYTFQLLAQNTRAVLDSAQVGNVIVLGHSMGGMIATRFTLLYPERVEKLILEDPIGLEDWKLKVPYQSVDEQYRNELKQNYASLKKYELDGYFHGVWSPAYDEMLNIVAGWTLSPEYDRVARNNALTSDMIFTQPVCYEFGGIRAPTLLIVGELDRTAIGKNLVSDSVRQTMGNYPVLGKLTQGKIPNCKLVILPGIGHVPHVEAFEAFEGPVLAFLGN